MTSQDKILTGFGLGEIPLEEKGENGPKVEFDSRKEFFATYLRYAQDPSIHVEYIPALKQTDQILKDGTFWNTQEVVGGVLKRDGVIILAFREEAARSDATIADVKNDIIYVKEGVLYDPKKDGSFHANEFKINGVPMYDFRKHNRYQALLEAGKLTPDEVRLLTGNLPLPSAA